MLSKKPKDVKKLPVIVADIFELKVINLINNVGAFVDNDVAINAAKLFQQYSLTFEQRSLVLSILSLTISREKEGKYKKSAVYLSFYAEYYDNLNLWLLSAINEKKYTFAIYFIEIIASGLDLVQLLTSKNSNLLQKIEIGLKKSNNVYANVLNIIKSSLNQVEKDSLSGSYVNDFWGFRIDVPNSLYDSSSLNTKDSKEQRSLVKTKIVDLQSNTEKLLKNINLILSKKKNSTYYDKLSEAESKKRSFPNVHDREVLVKKIKTTASDRPSHSLQASSTLDKLVSQAKKQQVAPKETENRPSNLNTLSEKKRIADKSTLSNNISNSNQFQRSSHYDSSDNYTEASSSYFTSFSDFRSSEGKSDKPKRSIRWADSSGNAELNQLKEYELQIYELLAMGTFKKNKHFYLLDSYPKDDPIHDIVNQFTDGSENNGMSYYDKRKNEHKYEKEEIVKNKEKLKLESLKMTAHIAWSPPYYISSDYRSNTNEVIVDSRESKLQTSRISKKLDIVYSRQSDIPYDPSDCTSESKQLSKTKFSTIIEIPWINSDEITNDYHNNNNTNSYNFDKPSADPYESFLSILPDYVHNLSTSQLAALLDTLSQPSYSYLLENPYSLEFEHLVSSITLSIP